MTVRAKDMKILIDAQSINVSTSLAASISGWCSAGGKVKKNFRDVLSKELLTADASHFMKTGFPFSGQSKSVCKWI